jgi:hypothetical protein
MMSSKLPAFALTLVICTPVHANQFEAVSAAEKNAFYSRPEREVSVQVEPDEKKHRIEPGFLGINLSYFNTTDEIWKRYGLEKKLKSAGIGALRYPGGEETSFFHWRHPGVNGYEDLWDDPSLHGTSPGRGKFQVTWVAPEKWECNDAFMDFDEFMAVCQTIEAEPIVGLNLSSGRKHNRREEGLQEALDWIRYAREQGYEVTYWFLDNEPWHHEANYTFSLEEYIEDCLTFGRAIKEEFPDVKLIANPAAGSNLDKEWVRKFASGAGEVIDYIDIHWYWAWGISNFDHWQEQTPLTTNDKWRTLRAHRTYGEEIAMIREACVEAGHPDIGVMVLEWNIAPSRESEIFSQSLIAVIQAEMLLEFAANGIEMTSLWPLLWQTSRDVWPEQDNFPSIVTAAPPFSPTLSSEMFSMISKLLGGTVLTSRSAQKDVVQLVVDCGETAFLYLINKSDLRRHVSVSWPGLSSQNTTARQISTKLQAPFDTPVVPDDDQLSFFAAPNSFTFVEIRK